VDNSFFVLHHGSQYLFMLIYVDGILVTATLILVLFALYCKKINHDFALKDLGQFFLENSGFLG
jgi:hypothetical protein